MNKEKKYTLLIIILIIIIIIAGVFISNHFSDKIKQAKIECKENKLKEQYDLLNIEKDTLIRFSENLIKNTEHFFNDSIAKKKKIKQIIYRIQEKEKNIKIIKNDNVKLDKELKELKTIVDTLKIEIISFYEVYIEQNPKVNEKNNRINLLESQIISKKERKKILLDSINFFKNKPYEIEISSIEPLDKNDKESSYSPNSIKKFRVYYTIKGCIHQKEKIKIFIYYQEALIPLNENNQFFFISNSSDRKDFIIINLSQKLTSGEYKICFSPKKKNNYGSCLNISVGNTNH